MPGELTPKQEKFAQKYVELGNASEAYRQAYDAENMSNEAIKVEACRLLQSPNVSLTVLELQEDHRERHRVTVDSLTTELEEARALAIRTEQCAAAVSASMGKAKIHGKLTDKTEHSGPNGGPIQTANTTAVADLKSLSLDEITRLFTERLKS